MGGVAVGIQADPAISAPVVGAIRVAIDLGLQFAKFFPRLTDMVCEFEDYLGPLAEHSRAADVELVENAVVSVYTNILDFSWKARCVFIDANGERRKWTSFRAFMRQHWDTFEAEFMSIKEDMRHHLDVLQHTIQATHFNAFRDVEQRKERSAFLTWVSTIDFEEVHQGIYAKKHRGTADWLIKKPKFRQWMQNPHSSLLWCNGKPGIGKSVLSSNVIEYITSETGLRKDTAICFTYYDYRDTRLENVARIIATLIKQLCQRKYEIPNNLLQIMRDARSPSLLGSLECFFLLAESFSEVFVIFDALDECPEQKRQDILGFIAEVVTTPASCRIKVFVTSRIETDITEAFVRNNVPTVQILAENVAADIEAFARSKVEELQTGRYGKILYVTNNELKEKIIRTLAEKAEGMFLWVNLQLDSLCEASKVRQDQVVEAALESLPHGLPDTYVRILDRIERQHPSMRDLALRCLTWTIYARRPLSTRELQHALAIDQECTLQQDPQLHPPQVILDACGNLLEEFKGAIRPIHYTVQEFFTSIIQGMPQHAMRMKLLDSNSAHRQLGLACLAYIDTMAFNAPTPYEDELYLRLLGNCLAGYAYQSFDYHVSNCNESSLDVMHQLNRLFHKESSYLAAILQIKLLRDGHGISNIRQRFNRMSFLVSPSTVVYSTTLYNIPAIRQQWDDQTPPAYALHFAASAGLANAVIRLLEGGCDIDEKDGRDSTSLYYACLNGDLDILQLLIRNGANVNKQGGYYGNTLQAASAGGHEQTVRVLLENKADVNANGGYFGNALQAASAGGHEQIIKVLLDNKADVNAKGGTYGNALQAASYGGHEQVVKMLLGNKASVNAQGGHYGNALQAASVGGHEQIVKVLLDNKADVNAKGGAYGNALQAASVGGHEQIVKVLLDKKSDVNVQGGTYGNALQAASYEGYKQIVKMLLDKKADVNVQGGTYGNALQAASYGGHEQIVKVLLDNKANVNMQGGRYGNALQAASYGGHEQIVKVLLDNKADVNAQSGVFGNALQAASYGGHEQIVKVLLENKVDVNAKGGIYGNALQVASYGGHEQIVKVLLDNEADVNAKEGRYGNALQAASYRGHEQIVKVLLDNKADINAQGGAYGNALQAASYGGHEQIVKVLLDSKADINAEGGHYGNALQAASAGGHEQVVKMLLDNKADVNVKGGTYGNALQAASYGGHEQTVKVLLDNKADVNAQGGHYDNALQAASYGGHEQIVQVLLDNKADVNAQAGHFGNALQAASYGGHEQIVKVLLDNKADVNAKGGYYGNALQAASRRRHEQIVKMLLDNKADINAQGGHYGNALQAAAYSGHEQIAKVLLENKAKVNVQGGRYGNALQAASAGGHEQIVKVLLGNDAKSDAQGGRYGNAMHAAAYSGHIEIINLLISNGNISTLQDYYGRSLLWWAAAGGNIATVEALINQHNIDPQTADKFGRKPFWVATKRGNFAVSKLLHEYDRETDIEQISSSDGSSGQPLLECDVCTSSITTTELHYHCNFCAGGDWDICEDCKRCGATCVETAHTLVKRTMLDKVWVEVTS